MPELAELRSRLAQPGPQGRTVFAPAVFAGVDGPRWFLRGVVGGEAAYQDQAAATIDELFSQVVVDRGDTPLPPRDLLPLHPPSGMRPVDPRTGQPAGPQRGGRGPARPPERGPEITEVG